MNHQPYLNLIGLAFKAGKCVGGEENILNSIRSNNVKILLIANDCGENTAKRLTDKCKTFAIPYMEADSREMLGRDIGKPERVAIDINDKDCAKGIKDKLSFHK